MFLQELRHEQKQLFLDLCIAVSSADGDFSTVERNLVKQLCAEMSIEEKYQLSANIDQTLDLLVATASKKEKRIMLIELAGIILADGVYAKEEEEFIAMLSEKFSVPKADTDAMIKVVLELYTIYGKFGSFLNGESF